MSLKAGTRFRLVFAALLLSAVATLGQAADSARDKNASGCSLSEEGGTATADGCRLGGESCWDCLYSDQYGYIMCHESFNATGWSYYCYAWQPENQM